MLFIIFLKEICETLQNIFVIKTINYLKTVFMFSNINQILHRGRICKLYKLTVLYKCKLFNS